MKSLRSFASGLLTVVAAAQAPPPLPQTSEPLVFVGASDGPAHDLRIVLVTGDEEYRSEESMPQLARILARLGASCTVLFAIGTDGTIDPGVVDNIPGLEALARADLLVLFTRFRDLPDAAMQHVDDYVNSGRPIVALRTSTHAFAPREGSRFARYAWNSKEPEGGFGRVVLGETWIAHHGKHGEQGTRGVVAPDAAEHAILRGVDASDVWDPADVYRVRLPLLPDITPLLLGLVLQTMAKDSPVLPDQGERMPIAWVRELPQPSGRRARVFTTTLGSAQAFTAAGTRRLLVNACLWAAGRDAAITADLDVALAGDYAPSPFGFLKHRRGVRPADLRAFAGRTAGEPRSIADIPFCWCPPGEFVMGSPPSEPERRADEERVAVTLTRGFWAAKFETTQGQWKRIVGALPGPLTTELPEGDDYPVGNVNFAEAEQFCAKLTALAQQRGELGSDWEVRLPTEAQWEYACRAGTTTATAFGERLGITQANIIEPYNGGEAGPALHRVAKVGSYPANAWGLCDMHANTFEWCRDWYHAKYPGGVDPDLHDALATAQQNRDGTWSRSRRGGAWTDEGWACRSAFRLKFEPERRYDHIGFRVVAVPVRTAR